MSVTFSKMNVYGINGMGAKVKMGTVPAEVTGLYYVGGIIYYIDSTADGVYEFYDENGDYISDVDVGDAPYAYRIVKAGTKDKYYVYYDEMITSKRWTYYKDGAYVYNSLGTADGIGKGKKNTAIVMAADSGAYITNDSNGVATIWYSLKQFRDAKKGGCDDWFVPSKAEVEALRSAIGFKQLTTDDDPVAVPCGKVTGGNIAGTYDGAIHYKDYTDGKIRMCYPSVNRFMDNDIWSSAEYSAQNAWSWSYYYQAWSNWLYKNYTNSVFFARAF